tara:strand:- start:525 stop:1217 length:693 start_codon:yes stop_codon:yes gene_type:complete
MDSKDIWVNIILPILIGPFFIYLKTLYDNHIKNKREHMILVYNTKYDRLLKMLNNFYWPLYLKLLCIYQLNYTIPLKNEYEYISDNSDDSYKSKNNLYSSNDSNDSDDSNNTDVHINIINKNNSINDIIIDTFTIELMEKNLNKLFEDAMDIIESNIYLSHNTDKLNKHLINFIKYCKIRCIIHEGSTKKKYNAEYLGVINNTNKLLDIIERNVVKYQKELNFLIETGPF